MSGTQCADFGGTELGETLCVMPEGHVYPGLITYRDGRVADITSESGGTVVIAGPNGTGTVTMEGVGAESLAITRGMADTEIGDCSARGMGGVSFSPMMSRYEGEEITWSAAEARELSRILGVSGTRSGSAFFCSNRENAGALVVASDAFHRPDLIAGIETLDSSCGDLDDTHCAAMLASLRTAAGMPAPESWWNQIRGIAGYLIGGVVVFVVGGLGSHVAARWWDGRGGDGNPPAGGAGTGSGTGVSAPSSNPVSETTSAFTEEQGLWTGLAVTCGVAAAILWADDATVIGVVDDPVAAVATVAAVAFLGLAVFSGEDTSGVPEA
ncbi:MAG TPA: hypothetical protein VLJ37_09675 [bacterium]|nr:hypothetical protein [bacterium]